MRSFGKNFEGENSRETMPLIGEEWWATWLSDELPGWVDRSLRRRVRGKAPRSPPPLAWPVISEQGMSIANSIYFFLHESF
jgi:hypothetical protein